MAENSPRLHHPSDIESIERATRRNRPAAAAIRHRGVLEEGVSRIGVDYAAVLTASRARCLASVREFTISAKPSRSAV